MEIIGGILTGLFFYWIFAAIHHDIVTYKEMVKKLNKELDKYNSDQI